MDVNFTDVLKFAVALAGAFITYRLALAAYFRQKEFENVRTRYLDQGVELACSQVDYALGVYRHNWMLMLRTLKQYREAEHLVPIDDFDAQLKEVDQSHFQLTPSHKVKALVGSDIFWIAHQKVFSFVGTANEAIKADFALALKGMVQQPQHPRKQEFLQTGFDKAQELNRDAGRYYEVLGELQNLAEMLERENLSRKAVQTFRDREDVKAVVNRVTALFPEQAEN